MCLPTICCQKQGRALQTKITGRHGTRRPLKIRAIPHNAILQQLGFLAVVISGMGTAANIDRERFIELYHDSPRLQQCIAHISEAKQLGSLNNTCLWPADG